MESEKTKTDNETTSPAKPVPNGSGNATKDDTCRCKEAQGKSITDFIKVMLDDLAFWRKKN